MSLKWFHIVFITSSAALALFITIWAIVNGRLVLAALAMSGGGALVVYQNKFVEKARRFGWK
jgi:hypothetical protein